VAIKIVLLRSFVPGLKTLPARSFFNSLPEAVMIHGFAADLPSRKTQQIQLLFSSTCIRQKLSSVLENG